MVDIVSYATVAVESDAVLKHQGSSPASSVSIKSENLPQISPNASKPQDASSLDRAPDVRLEITKLKHLNAFVYKLIDKKSGEVVRQWPTQQMVEMKEYLVKQQIQLLDEQA
jgi:hypothetical protein